MKLKMTDDEMEADIMGKFSWARRTANLRLFHSLFFMVVRLGLDVDTVLAKLQCQIITGQSDQLPLQGRKKTEECEDTVKIFAELRARWENEADKRRSQTV